MGNSENTEGFANTENSERRCYIDEVALCSIVEGLRGVRHQPLLRALRALRDLCVTRDQAVPETSFSTDPSRSNIKRRARSMTCGSCEEKINVRL